MPRRGVTISNCRTRTALCTSRGCSCWTRTAVPSRSPFHRPGFVAGLYAQTDKRRGVWKSPAGTQVLVGGAVGLTTELTDVEQGGLNVHPKSVSVIRRFPNSGTVLWGARTLSSDPEYRYTAVRRMAIFLRVSIFNGIQWAVFRAERRSAVGAAAAETSTRS